MSLFLDLLAGFLVVAALAPLFLARWIERRRCTALVATFGGKISFLGTYSFTFDGVSYSISRIGVAGAYGRGGSYPVLATIVGPSAKTILGPTDSKKFAIGAFWFLPPNENIKIGPNEVLAGSKDARVLETIRAHAADNRFEKACAFLFDREFCHITVNAGVLRYTSLPKEIYKDPEVLKAYLQSVATCCQVLNLRPQAGRAPID